MSNCYAMPAPAGRRSAPRAWVPSLLSSWVWLAALCLALGAAGVQAQTPSSLSEWQYSVGVPLERLYEPEIPTWQVVVGVAGAVRPFYDGAQRYHFLGGP